MNIVRSMSALTAPPPSPIPTARGSRSAANDTLSRFLDNSSHVPDLTLPEPQIPRHQPIPEEIDIRSLKSRDGDSVDRLLRSAGQFGAFRISHHGIFGEELGSLVKEAERVFRILEKRDSGYIPNFGNREEIVWVRSAKERMQWAREYIGAERYQSFSEIMENVASKLDVIAEELSQVFAENAGKQFQKKLHGKEPVLSLYRYSHGNFEDQKSPPLNEENCKSCDYTLSLHLPVEDCGFCVQSGQGPMSFPTGPNTVVVTVGKQLEEWSLDKFKSVSGEVIFDSGFQGSQASFAIELRCPSLDSNHSFTKSYKTISIADQILIALIIALLYKFSVFSLS